jgi:SAM-dependent methyltransferase
MPHPANRGGHHGIRALLCPPPGGDAPDEFAFGWTRLRESFGSATRCLDPGPLPVGNDMARRVAPLLAGMADADRVAWMPHAQVMVMPCVLERLAHALEADPGLTAALAHDQHFAPQPAPDYCTERGLERYLARLGEQHGMLPFTGQASPALTLTTAGALRGGTVWSRAAWVGNTCVHDFADYQRAARDEILPLVPALARRVLDVGGGEGHFLARLRAARPSQPPLETHLAEQSPQACARARARVDRVWEGDFAALPIEGRFDCISFLEALEHTTDPLAWLRRARELLAPGGAVVASVPNAGHWSVIADLLEGRWDTSPVGIHCVTHLRFFTEHGLRALFARAGLRIARLEALCIACPPDWREAWLGAAGPRLAAAPTSWDSYAFLVQAVADDDPHGAHGAAGPPSAAQAAQP